MRCEAGISGRSAASTFCSLQTVTHSRPAIHELLDTHGLAARRELGQNFVADPNTVRRIAALADVGPGDLVIEIGPGLGSLTLALIETGADVVAVEVDRGLAAVAKSVVGDRARVIEADALTLDWAATIGDHDGPVHVVSNLPYNIGTTLVLDILADVRRVSTLTVLVQSEVADRFAAPVGSKIYGIPSVMTALHATAEVVATVPPTVFVPRPNVQSSVVRLVRHDAPPVIEHGALATVVRAGFGQRRKMVRRSLGGLLTETQIAEVEVDPTTRAEQLDLDAWVRLAQAVQSSS